MKSPTQNNSWVKVYRKFLEWEWYDDINVCRLFLHILLKANFKDKSWKGEEIKRGQLLTGRFKLSEETGLTQQQIRTALGKLISTNEITKQSTSQYTIITMNNYNRYQTVTNESTNEQPTGNQRITTTKERKKEKKEKKYIYKGLEDVICTYNRCFKRNTTSTKGFERNYLYWRGVHSIEKIQRAIENASRDRFWKDKMTLTIMFRQKNTNGEPVDYIEDLATRKVSTGGNIGII